MKGIMAIKGRARRVVLGAIDVLIYFTIAAVYLGIDYLFLNEAITHIGSYVINSLILLAFISVFRIVLGTYTNVW